MTRRKNDHSPTARIVRLEPLEERALLSCTQVSNDLNYVETSEVTLIDFGPLDLSEMEFLDDDVSEENAVSNAQGERVFEIALNDGIVKIVGTNGNDVVEIRQNQTTITVSVNGTINGNSGQSQSFPIKNVNAIECETLSGDDSITVDVSITKDNSTKSVQSVVVRAGAGDDSLVDTRGGAELYGESGNDFFDSRNDVWNFVDGGSGVNVHKRDSFDVGTAITYTNPYEESETNKPIVVKVMVLDFDPIVESEGGKHLHEVFQWRNPVYNIMAYKEALERVSGGFITFEITHWTSFNEFPYFTDGYQYTPEEYVANRRSNSGWHDGTADVCRAMNDAGVPALVNAGEVDEIWWVGEHFVPSGGEAFMVGPGAFFINGSVYPDLAVDRPIAVVGMSYERELYCELEDMSHRSENHIGRSYGNRWNLANPSSTWDYFGANVTQSPATPGVGSCHYAPNSSSDYDWGNKTYVETNADDWLNYPNMTGTTSVMNADNWNETHHHQWWFEHFPRAAGTGLDGRQANWWKYLFDFNNYEGGSGAPKDFRVVATHADAVHEYGANSYSFTVTYASPNYVDISTLAQPSVRVSKGNWSTVATLKNMSDKQDDPWVVATYSFTPPGGAWDASDDGLYRIALEGNIVKDCAGTALASQLLGVVDVRSNLNAFPLEYDEYTSFLLRADGSTTDESGLTPTTSSTLSYYDGIIDRALRFDSDEYLSYQANDVANAPEGTIEFWYQPNADRSGDTARKTWTFAELGTPFNNGIVIQVDGANNYRALFWGDNPATEAVERNWETGVSMNANSWKAGEWLHIATTWDASGNQSLYLNGQCVASITNGISISDFASNAKLTIGRQGQSAQGLIDEFRISTIARSAGEIARDYEIGHGATETSINEPVFPPTPYVNVCNVDLPVADASGVLPVDSDSTFVLRGNNTTVAETGQKALYGVDVNYCAGFSGKALSLCHNSFLAYEQPGAVNAEEGTIEFLWRSDLDASGSFSSYAGDVFRIGFQENDNRNFIRFHVESGGNVAALFYGDNPATEELEINSESVVYTSGSSLKDGGFHYIAITWKKGEEVALYVDGVKKASKSQPSTPSYFGQDSILSIGGINNTAGGALDDLRISSRARTEAEILDISESYVPSSENGEWIVTTTQDDATLSGSLRYALANMSNGDVVSFAPSLNGQTIKLDGTPLLVGKSVTIDASSLADGVTIDGDGKSRVFTVHSAIGTSTVEMIGLTITGGLTSGTNDADGGAGVYNQGEKLTLTNCVVTGNESSSLGGGIYNTGTITISGGSITDNKTSPNRNNTGGAGLYSVGYATLANVVVSENHAEGKNDSQGGAVYARGSFVANNCEFKNNTTLGRYSVWGGAVFVYEESEATISNSSFISNESKHTEESWNVRGGAICNRGTLTVDGCSFTSNTLVGKYAYGGAIDNYDGTLEVKDSAFEQNTTGDSTSNAGGAIFSRHGSVTLQTSSFKNNKSHGSGGAIYVERAGTEDEVFFKSINCNYEGNQSQDCAGAVYVDSMTSTIQGGEFKENSASSLGGAIRFVQGTATIESVGFVSNLSGNEGGAIQTHENVLNIVNTTFSNNQGQRGGALRLYKTPFTITESSFVDNISGREGGAIKNDDCAEAVIASCVFSGNSASYVGGAIQIWNTTSYLFDNIEFTDNVSANRGGAIHLSGGENVSATLKNIKANGNSSGEPGGAFYLNISSGKVVVQDAEFDSNKTANYGGAVYTEGGQTEFERVVAKNNVARNNDGGAFTLNGTNTIVDSVFTGNSGYHGGAIRNDGDLEISSCVFSENAAKDNGGAIYHCRSDKSFKIENSSIVYNTCLGVSNGSGGAIEAYGMMEIANSFLAGNAVSERGGAIWFNNDLKLVNVTVAHNSAREGGGIWQDGGDFTAINALIASNQASSYEDVRANKTNSSSHNNVVGNGDNFSGLSNGVNGNQLGSTANPLDACVGPVTQNEQGRYFIPIASFSPAVDAGYDSDQIPAVDALGQFRFDALKANAGSGTKKYVDVGAYEYQGSNPEGQVDYSRLNGGKYHSLAVDSRNFVYATDLENGVVRVFDAAGKETRIVGEWGEGAGRLVSPRGIAIGENDALYVLSAEGVVQVFDSTGKHKQTLCANAGFSNPQGICFDVATKRLYVVDSGNNRVLCFSSTGSRVWVAGSATAKSDHTGFDNPTSIAVHPKTGELWIADYNNDRIEIYNAQGKYVATKDVVSKPTSLAFDSDGNLFYGANANSMSGKVYYEGRLGALRNGQTYAGPYFFGGLDDLGRITQGVAVRADGNVVFVDALNRRIVQTTPDFNQTTGPTSYDAFSVPIDNLDIDANGTTAKFTWTTKDPVATYVKVGTSTNNMEIVAQNATKTDNHSITVSNLTPQTTLYYQVGYPDSFNGNIRWTIPERFNTGVEVGQKQILRLKALTVIYTDKNFGKGYDGMTQAEIDDVLDSFHKTCQYIYQATRFNVWIDEVDVLFFDGDLLNDELNVSEQLAKDKGYSVDTDFDIISSFRAWNNGGGHGVGGSGGFLDRWVGFQSTTYGDGFNVHELDHAFDYALYGDFIRYRDCHSTWQIIDSEGVEDGIHNAAIYGGLLDANYAACNGNFHKLIVAPDVDDDGVPDLSPTDQGLVRPLPVTEKTLGTSTSKKDTDSDGLSDLQEATLFIYGGSDPVDPDSNDDGTCDGSDLNPVYAMNGDVWQGTPTIDGKINEDEWTQVTDHYAYPSEYYLRSNGNTDVFSLYSSWDEDYLYLGFKTDGAHRINVRLDGGCDNITVGQDNITLSFYSNASSISSVSGGLYNFDVNDISEKLGGSGSWISSGMYIMDLQDAIYTKDDIVCSHSYNKAFNVYEWEIAIPWKNEVTGFNPYNKKVMGLALYVDGNYVFNGGGYGKLRLNKTFNLGFDLSNASVAENKSAETVVGTFSTSDPGLESGVVYSLVASTETLNQDYFKIDGNKLKLAKPLDFESQPICRISVRADFGENGVEEKMFEITTIDVAEPIDVSLSGYSGTYDKQSHGATITGIKTGDVVRYSVDGENWTETAPQFVDAGSYSVHVTVRREAFDPWTGSTNVTVGQRGVKVAVVSVEPKAYDGAKTAIGVYKLEGVLDGDEVALTGGAFEFANANAGENKTVTFKNYSLKGSENYILSNSSVTWTQGVITPRVVDVEWQVKDEYVYSGEAQNASVVAGFIDVQNRWQNVEVAFSGQGAEFLNAGQYAATASFESVNYVLDNNLEKQLTIKPAPITLSFVPSKKTYDGTDRAAYSYSLSGTFGTDEASLKSATCKFSDKNAGEGKTVTLSNCVLNNPNYVLTETSQTVDTGIIVPRTLSYSGGRVSDKTWDGTVDATFVEGELGNVIKGDDLSISTSCVFPDSIPGQYDVKVSFTLTGADASNYKAIADRSYSAKIKLGIALDSEVYEVNAGNDVHAVAQAFGCSNATFVWSINSKTLDETGSEIWIPVGTEKLSVGDYTLTTRALSNGINSDLAIAKLRVLPTSPSFYVEAIPLFNGQGVALVVDRYEFGGIAPYRQVIDWGDGTESETDALGTRSIFTHFYQDWNETSRYIVELNLFKPENDEPEIFQLACWEKVSDLDLAFAQYDEEELELDFVEEL